MQFPTIADLQNMTNKDILAYSTKVIEALHVFETSLNTDYSSVNTFMAAIAQLNQNTGFNG